MEARLCFLGHVLMENRNGLVVDAELTRASGHAERLAALVMLDRLPTASPATLGADKGRRPGLRPRAAGATGHAAPCPEHQQPTLGDRRTDHAASRLRRDQKIRKRIQEAFSWIKTTAGQAHPPAWRRAGALVLHAHRRRLQAGPPAQAGTCLMIGYFPIGRRSSRGAPDRQRAVNQQPIERPPPPQRSPSSTT